MLVLASHGLDPTGKGVPENRVADGRRYLFHKDEKSSCPERSAMNLTRGPQIVDHQNCQENIGEQRRSERISVNQSQGPTSDGGDH